MVCIQRPYYHFGVQRHIYISILEIPAHIYIYMYIYNYIYLYASGDQVVCAHKPYYYLYILHSTHEIFYISKINNETFYPLGVGVASGPSAPYGTRLGTDGSGL